MNVTERRMQLGDVDEALLLLPDNFAVASLSDARLVFGPPGAFVLSVSPSQAASDLRSHAARINQLTASTRSILAEHLTWVPFVDALLVTHSSRSRRAPVTVVPLDLLVDMLTEGRPVVADATLAAVRDLLRRGKLGDWRVGLGHAGDKIDLCDPAPTISMP